MNKPLPILPSRVEKPIRILLADDHAVIREGLRNLLACQPDLEVVGEAEDGQVAVMMAQATAPHVVVMDVHMPNVDGIEATRRLTAQMPDVHVVALSMNQESEIVESVLAAGACAYVSKLGAPDELCSVIRSAAGSKARSQPAS